MTENEIINKIAVLEATVSLHTGNIEILMAFIAFKGEKDKYMEFLKFVVSSGKFTKEANVVAEKLLDLEDIWGESFSHEQTLQ